MWWRLGEKSLDIHGDDEYDHDDIHDEYGEYDHDDIHDEHGEYDHDDIHDDDHHHDRR
ncbi:hypothetical protein GCM10009021_05270 [Halarchaeum nitratireducens]|uniref:Uncharacterized protein n=1 Tax=Halarchaeum nitratireducens TaxID=489913 RepID=A0A830G7Y4_9EURY|nr:hypothetical protein GCM10009021_05270 [Halarchaeum nitratireducens]